MTEDRDTLTRDASTDEPDTSAQSGSSGGRIQQDIGARADEAAQVEGRERVTSVHKSDHPDGGDEPNLPNRTQGGGNGKVPPRRTS